MRSEMKEAATTPTHSFPVMNPRSYHHTVGVDKRQVFVHVSTCYINTVGLYVVPDLTQ